MRRSRQFRPGAPAPLEERVVLSHVSPLGHRPAHLKATALAKASMTPTPDNVVKGNVGSFHGLDMAQTLAAGDPVFEEITTRYSNGSTQTEARQISPDKAANTVTTSKTINLRNVVGQERVVDVATTTGRVTNHNITISLPGGATETETRAELNQGDKTQVKGSITLPGGSTKTYTGTITTVGGKVTTDETFTDPEGFNTHVVTVVTVHDELSQSTNVTTTYPDGTSMTSDSNTFVLRLTPPH